MPIPQMGGVSMMNPVNAVVHNPYTPQPYGYGAFGQQSPSPYGQLQGGVHGRAPFPSSNIPMELIVGRQQTPQNFPPSMDMFSPFQNSEDQANSNPKQMDHMQTEVVADATSPQSQSSLPKFLQGGPQWAIDEFKRIVRTPKSTYAEQVKQIEKMVEKLDTNRQDLYKKFMQENDEIEKRHRDKIHRHVGQMSDKAQEQFAKTSAVLRNPGVPDHERWERVMAIYGKLEPDLRNEFEEKFKAFSDAAN